ncbi:MAG: adenylate/guanylate cyclase domain-containing protein [Rhodospirillales bacterium]|nr:adenylate/guanylate cyclase domain-containing protein [Rhodospirillales bacterium]
MHSEEQSIGSGSGLIDAIADWLISESLGNSTVETLFEGACTRLHSAGIPLWRVALAFRTLHPLFGSVTLIWQRETEGLEVMGHRHGLADTSEAWKRSPFYHMLNTGVPFLRRRLDGPDALLDFPILPEIKEKGATDYLAYAVEFGGEKRGDHEPDDGIIVSWTADRPGGFSDQDIQALLRIQRRLAVACKVTIREQITDNILTAYLGPDAGQQVKRGQIQLGMGENIHAVIWFSDLRNSTGMADTLPPDDYLNAVNDYFDGTAGAVLANNGEVLRFIGDAVLAIFPIRKKGKAAAQRACRNALKAAEESNRRMREINARRLEEGGPILNYGVGLHLGDVMFDNIGVPERVEFSVIGPAANEAARLENLTKTLRCPVLVSGEFAEVLDIEWQHMGTHDLRGVGDKMDVFVPPECECRMVAVA